MTQLATEIHLPDMTNVGAMPPLELPATRYSQGGRIQYHISVPVIQVAKLVQKPDPTHPLEGNRKVDASRAKKFGIYVRRKRDWVSPAIIVRTDGDGLEFVPLKEFPNGTCWGILRIPQELLQKLLLLDGQHRSLGLVMAEDEARDQIRKLKAEIDRIATRGGGPQRVEALEQQLQSEEAILKRLRDEHLSIDLVEVSTDGAKQMFVDIANNAKGVNPDYTTVLDQRDVVNRIAVDVMQTHRLLIDNVEIGQSTRMSSGNPHLLGAKAVADMARAVLVGTCRVGARVGERLTADVAGATQRVSSFFDTLTAAFPELEDIAAGRLSPEQLREQSMLGSSTMLRVLAAVYSILTDRETAGSYKPWSRSEVEDFFRKLNPYLGRIPIDPEDKLWMSTGAFIPGTKAPQARQGSIKALTDHFVSWAREGIPA